MLYKVSPFGYFGRVAKVSRGPWFNEWYVEDDGLEYFYAFNSNGEIVYLLSNNIPLEDREKMQRMFKAIERNRYLAWFGGLWLGFEAVARVPYFKGMALGWKVMSMFGLGYLMKTGFTFYNAQTYGPIVSAFLRRHGHTARGDRSKITDRKREYFYIDTSSYMNYDFEDLGHDFHALHGPQPDGETLDSSWLAELDKFLRGEENKLKEHPMYVNYNYEYIDKSYPTAEMAHELFHRPAVPDEAAKH